MSRGFPLHRGDEAYADGPDRATWAATAARSFRFSFASTGADLGITVKAAQLSGEEAVTRANTEMLVPFKKSDGSYRIENKFRFLLSTV